MKVRSDFDRPAIRSLQIQDWYQDELEVEEVLSSDHRVVVTLRVFGGSRRCEDAGRVLSIDLDLDDLDEVIHVLKTIRNKAPQ